MKQLEVHEPELHTSPVPQLVPFESEVHPDVLFPGWQLWHALVGSVAPEAYGLPSISHPDPHAPLWQSWLFPQFVPFAALVHAVVLFAGWQL